MKRGFEHSPAAHHPDKTIQPSEAEGDFPLEIETKILFRGSLEQFHSLMKSKGAELVCERRLIDDLRYQASEDYHAGALHKVPFKALEAPEGHQPGYKEIIGAFDLLGFEVLDDENHKDRDGFYVRSPQKLSNTTIRIRRDGEDLDFTTKRRIEKNGERQFEVKAEIELKLKKSKRLKNLFKEIGLEIESHRQKYRTSYQLPGGQLVELNESAIDSAPFWIEIEGKNYNDIKAAALDLGFTEADFFKGSDTKFLMEKAGLSKKQTHLALFKKQKTDE